jgi:hypothetical protein
METHLEPFSFSYDPGSRTISPYITITISYDDKNGFTVEKSYDASPSDFREVGICPTEITWEYSGKKLGEILDILSHQTSKPILAVEEFVLSEDFGDLYSDSGEKINLSVIRKMELVGYNSQEIHEYIESLTQEETLVFSESGLVEPYDAVEIEYLGVAAWSVRLLEPSMDEELPFMNEMFSEDTFSKIWTRCLEGEIPFSKSQLKRKLLQDDQGWKTAINRLSLPGYIR